MEVEVDNEILVEMIESNNLIKENGIPNDIICNSLKVNYKSYTLIKTTNEIQNIFCNMDNIYSYKYILLIKNQENSDFLESFKKKIYYIINYNKYFWCLYDLIDLYDEQDLYDLVSYHFNEDMMSLLNLNKDDYEYDYKITIKNGGYINPLPVRDFLI